MRALTALQAALTEDQMMEHMELHSYTLNLRIKVLNFLSRLEVLGLVYKVLYASTYAFSACRNYTFPYFC
jgi:hypothetical protein